MAMTIVLVHEHLDEAHLDAVIQEMQTLGTPTIRAIKTDDNFWYALEGCHRLRAAHRPGLTPIIDEVEYNDDIITVQVDGDDEQVVTSEYADELMGYSPRINNRMLQF